MINLVLPKVFFLALLKGLLEKKMGGASGRPSKPTPSPPIDLYTSAPLESALLEADKFLLAARSEYFERMLRTGMSEAHGLGCRGRLGGWRTVGLGFGCWVGWQMG